MLAFLGSIFYDFHDLFKLRRLFCFSAICLREQLFASFSLLMLLFFPAWCHKPGVTQSRVMWLSTIDWCDWGIALYDFMLVF